MSEPLRFVLVRETAAQSWVRDTYSAAVLVAAMWFNATYCGGSAWIYFFTGLLWLLWLIGKASKYRHEMTPAEARAWLERNFPRGDHLSTQTGDEG